MPPGFSPDDFRLLLPELVLSAGLLLVLVVDVLTPRDKQARLGWLTIAAIAATGLALASVAAAPPTTIARGLLAVDGFALFFKVLFLASAAITVLMSGRFLEVEGARAGEYYFLVLAATLGMMIMASAVDLITIFIGLETMAVAFYILAGYIKPSRRSNEAAVKYFLLGAFSLGILLYGMSLLYGLSGSTGLHTIVTALAGQSDGLAAKLAVILVVAGVGFKISAVPFHMWAPDVYEGAPTPITGFLSVGSKAASFAMILRIFFEGLPALRDDWQFLFYTLAVLTMTVGNLAAITQSNMKRMLAYSSIAHAGYVLIGVVVATPRGVTATLVYLMVYVFMQFGAFAVVTMLRREDVVGDELKDFSGLFVRRPGAAIAMLIFLLSLGGIPPTAGFMGKFWLFSAAIDAGYVWLAVIGVLNSAVSLYYYVRVVVFMWLREEVAGSPVVIGPAMATVIAGSVVVTLALGVYPRPLFELAEASASTLGLARVATVAGP